MRAWGSGAALAVMLTLISASAGGAQEATDGAAMAVLTLDQDRLFAGSLFGRQSLAELEVQARALQTENRRIESDLETEEKSLTERRAAMTPEEFRAEADAFDAKVKGIRSAQEAKARELAGQRDAARQRFLQASAPVLAQIMQERGAVAILDRSAIILSFDRADVTDLAIARIDAVLADDTAPDGGDPQTGAVPAPEPQAPDAPAVGVDAGVGMPGPSNAPVQPSGTPPPP